MVFNPDPNMVIFSRKIKPVNHHFLYLNNYPVSCAPSQKYVGLIIDKTIVFTSAEIKL